MVSINYSSREVCCKIVYYGPGLSGKTTNLQYVHSKVPSNTRGKLISLATESDRTLYFDFLPINIGTINGFAAKFQLYTVPGQVYYNATRKLVLRGVDGVVFVADSQPDKMDENIESLTNLEENLREYGYDVNDMPLVIQYNKRDLPGVMTVEQLNAILNPQGRPWYEASATIGNGVFDTLKLIIKLVLEKAKSTGSPRSSPPDQPTEVTAPSVPVATVTTDAATTTRRESIPQAVGVTAGPESPTPAALPVAASAGTVTVAAPVDTPTSATEEAAPKPTDTSVPYPARPFPGSDEPAAAPRKISPTGFAPTRPARPEEASIEQKTIGHGSVDPDTPSESARTPLMAPALRRRSYKKKRGFFKRLFGLK